MKKFISLLMAVFMVFSLTISASATGGVKYSYGGAIVADIDTVWTDKTTYPYALIKEFGETYMLVLTRYDYFVETREPDAMVQQRSGTAKPSYVYKVATNEWVYSESNTGMNVSNLDMVMWVSTPVYYNNTSEIIFDTSERLESSCDGSSCSATDANIDGICDDCGATLMNLSRTPVAPTVDGSNKNYVMFYSGTVYKYTAYTSDESYTIRGEEYGTRYRTYTDPSVTVQRFESYDGINWEQTYNGKTANDYPGEIGYELISSTFDWYTEAGDHFFPVPLWKEIQEVTQGEMTGLEAETAGTMKVLVLSGVGLMASLVALSLFGKRSLIFLR